MDKPAVQNVLDKAIADVGRTEFGSLAYGLPPHQVARYVEYALDQLRRLAKGEMPNYDQWVALFYGLWYQPKHINLAYRMIDVMAKGRNPQNPVLTGRRALHIVDFGCGSFAMQFGVALAAATALSKGQRIEAIRVDAIDSSDAMVRMGQSMWEKFVQRVSEISGKNDWLTCLERVCGLIEYNVWTECGIQAIVDGLDNNPREEQWLSVIHAVYEKTVPAIQQTLASLYDGIRPQTGFITTFNEKIDLAKAVSPFDDEAYSKRYLEIGGGLDGQLPEIFRLRLGVLQKLEQSGALLNTAINASMVRGYLRNPVTWQPSDVGYLIYTKR